MDQLKKLVREYPDSRYASDALAKIDVCRGRLAQKELWVAAYYLENENNPVAARQRSRECSRTTSQPRRPRDAVSARHINAREGRRTRRSRCSRSSRTNTPNRVGRARPASAGGGTR